MNALIWLLISAALGIALFWIGNRKTFDQVNTAAQELRSRASKLNPQSVDGFIESLMLAEEDKYGARVVLLEISELLEVQPEKLAYSYELSELLVYHPDLRECGAACGIDPFSYMLAERIMGKSRKDLWNERWASQPGLPRNERELTEFISHMNIEEFIRFFSPLIKKGEGSRSIFHRRS
ncbi:hypothetical protein [Thiorhodococcus minor]|uniref:Uncharacterized protein n=1 Tax=Thiorhodococcus minor TaxID=57489 RepID=A0A6M0K6I0_9GAMM|nr:hypothetical protein [Thiorhodococcus minor]NEV65362.1 hypothetical protein [Thiorhodococcus minor]